MAQSDLEAAAELIYDSVSCKGFNRSDDANHQLMDEIKDLELDNDASRNCWNLLWETYKTELTELGYTPGF